MSQEEFNQLQSQRESQDTSSTDTESIDSSDGDEENILELLNERFLWESQMSSRIKQLNCKKLSH